MNCAYCATVITAFAPNIASRPNPVARLAVRSITKAGHIAPGAAVKDFALGPAVRGNDDQVIARIPAQHVTPQTAGKQHLAVPYPPDGRALR